MYRKSKDNCEPYLFYCNLRLRVISEQQFDTDFPSIRAGIPHFSNRGRSDDPPDHCRKNHNNLFLLT